MSRTNEPKRPYARSETNQDRAEEDSEHLEKFDWMLEEVMPALNGGIRELVKETPSNPIEFLGNYLVKIADADEKR